MAGLADLQGWLQAAMLDGEAEGQRDHVRGDNRLTAGMRLGIYAQGYRQRLIECLETEYPVLAALAGPTAFGLFAQGYIAAHPSRSYTLYDFGVGFADYLEGARPAGDGTPQTIEAVPAALARIERAKAEVHRARGTERDAPAPAETGFDPVMLEILGFGFSAGRACHRPDSVRLLTLPFDFTETLAAAARQEAPPMPDLVPSFVAVARSHYHVTCHRLEEWQYTWLAGLPGPPDDPRLITWLPTAITAGLVTCDRPPAPVATDVATLALSPSGPVDLDRPSRAPFPPEL